MLGLVYGYVPFLVLPLYAALDRIDTRMLEASRDLGMGRAATFLRVTLPLSRQGMLAAAVLTALPMAGDYYTADLLSGSPRTSMIGNQIEFYLFRGAQKAAGASLVIILSALLLVAMYWYLRAVDRAARDAAHEADRALVGGPVAAAGVPRHGDVAVRRLVARAGADRHPVLVQRRAVAQRVAGLLVALVVG